MRTTQGSIYFKSPHCFHQMRKCGNQNNIPVNIVIHSVFFFEFSINPDARASVTGTPLFILISISTSLSEPNPKRKAYHIVKSPPMNSEEKRSATITAKNEINNRL